MAVPKDIRLLVADGDPTIRKALGKELRQIGLANVVFAGELQSTAAALKNGHFDLLVVDWDIAAFKDFLLVRKIRTSNRLSEIPILVMAREDTKENRRQAKSAGAGGFVAKPFATQALLAEVEASLKGRKRAVAPVVPGAKAATPGPAGKAAPAPAQAPAPLDPRAKQLFQAGYAKLKAQQFDEALKDFEQAFKIDDLFAEAYKGAAFAAKGRGDAAGSKHFMGKAAESYVVHDRHEDAATIYGNLRKADPNAPNPFKNAGKRLRAEGRLDSAAAALEKGFEFSPQDDELAAELAFTYKDQGADEKAEDFLRELLGGDGEFPLAAETFLSLTGQDFYSIGGGDVGEAPEMQFLEDKKNVKKSGADLRTAKRLAMADYSARELKTKVLLSVIDISITGIGFKPMAGKFKEGDVVRFDLIALGNVKAKKMAAKVMRVTPNVVGCQFVEVSGKQKKVLEVLFGKD
ncbi:MAG: response regulator [Desulfovibrionaceae bacterium]